MGDKPLLRKELSKYIKCLWNRIILTNKQSTLNTEHIKNGILTSKTTCKQAFPLFNSSINKESSSRVVVREDAVSRANEDRRSVIKMLRACLLNSKENNEKLTGIPNPTRYDLCIVNSRIRLRKFQSVPKQRHIPIHNDTLIDLSPKINPVQKPTRTKLMSILGFKNTKIKENFKGFLRKVEPPTSK